MDYNDVVSYSMPESDYLVRRLQRFQLAATGFVRDKFVEVLKHLRLQQHVPARTLRSSSKIRLTTANIAQYYRCYKFYKYYNYCSNHTYYSYYSY